MSEAQWSRSVDDPSSRAELTGVRRAITEFLWFGIKEARACLFAGLFFIAVFGVPLFSGFMYAAVGSYIIQSWRLFDLRVRSLLVVMTFTIVANLKHIKERVHVPA